MGSDFSVGNVRDALSAFNRLISPTHKKVFDGIFKTLETGLAKLGTDSGSQTKAVKELIKLINDIPMDDKQDYDVLGFIYEYLISNFAANAGKKAGEFYTPHEVSILMSEIIANHLRIEMRLKSMTRQVDLAHYLSISVKVWPSILMIKTESNIMHRSLRKTHITLLE